MQTSQTELKSEKVKLSRIRTDAEMWSRSAIDKPAVEEYADTYRDEAKRSEMPPVVLFKEGEEYWPGDGIHRCLGAIVAGLKEISAVVFIGNQRDANIYGATCNTTHGVRRTRKDMDKLIRHFLLDSEWQNQSERKIAEACRTSHTTVQNIRKKMLEEGAFTTPTQAQGKDGKTYTRRDAPQVATLPTETDVGDRCEHVATLPAAVLDALGNVVPVEYAAVFSALPAFTSIESAFDRIRHEVSALVDEPGGSWLRMDAKDLEAGLKSLKAMVRDRRPHGVCPWCRGNKEIGIHTCNACKGRGFATKMIYDLPRERSA